ncbi:MAG: AzlD domain-containing protein [Actinomycetota bacterium]
MNPILLFALAGVITFAIRASLVVAGDRPALQGVVASHAPLVAPAVLSAIVASALLVSDEGIGPADPAAVVAVIAGAVAVHRQGNAFTALLVGLPVYWACTALGLG